MTTLPSNPTPGPETTSAPLVEHLRELRTRLIICVATLVVAMVSCYLVKEEIFHFLTAPLAQAQQSPQMIFTAVHELFFTYLKLSFQAGLYLTIPILLFEVWRFVAPGLYANEKRVLLPLLILTPALFYLGGAFTYFVIAPIIISFFMQFQTDTITALPAVREYLSFLTSMIFAFGFAFELPVFLLILAKVGLVTADKLANFRRYAIVIIFVVAAVLTPPDPFSQTLLAVPMIILYELSIWGARWMNRPQAAQPSGVSE